MTSPTWRRSSSGCLASSAATSRPRPPSTGATPAPTSSGSCAGSMKRSSSPVPHDHHARTSIRQYLGVPTVAGRTAQTVVARRLEQKVEPIFHPDSYGCRPGRSALDAVAACRRRCWNYDWVIDLDIQKFFGSVPWELVVRAVAAHTDQPWVVLYVTRWLQAPLQLPDGTLQQRDRGTPQGSAVSPVLANLFMHYGFDRWMAGRCPTVQFERYAADAVVRCVSERQADMLVKAIAGRLAELASWVNPIVRGWMQYYGAFYRSGLYPLLRRINAYLVRWLREKFKRLRPFNKAKACWQRITRQDPSAFAHWAWVVWF